MVAGLRKFEAARPDECELIPSEDQFYGFSRGVNRLSKHIQWVYVPAVKDAASEQVEARNSALGKLLARTVRSKTNFDEEIRMLRTRMLALLQELSGTDDAAGSTLILACEEPELYQHPPQARHLAAVLNTLSKGNAQVIVSTHDPLFVSGQGFEDVRMIRKDVGQRHSAVSHMSFDEISQAVAAATGEQPVQPEGVLAKIHQALQPALNEMFFTRRLILVEGLEDVAYLLSCLNLLEKAEEFRRLGGHIVASNGKSELGAVLGWRIGITLFQRFRLLRREAYGDLVTIGA